MSGSVFRGEHVCYVLTREQCQKTADAECSNYMIDRLNLIIPDGK